MQACGWHYRMTSHPERQRNDIRWADRVINTDRHWLRPLQTNLGSCRCGERPKHVQINTLKILWKTQASAAFMHINYKLPKSLSTSDKASPSDFSVASCAEWKLVALQSVLFNPHQSSCWQMATWVSYEFFQEKNKCLTKLETYAG